MNFKVPEIKGRDGQLMLILPKFTTHRLYFYPRNILSFYLSSLLV